jgi:Phage tail tube protein, GTA-gp10
MSKCAKFINWAGGSHVFDLNSPRVAWMLQQRQAPFPGQYGDTPAACLRRFEEGVYSPTDIEQIFRIGLIGGGLSESQADGLIGQHVRGAPIAENAVVAVEVLSNLFTGAENVSTSA